MHTFVIVAAKPGRSIPPSVVERIEREPADLPFTAESTTTWTDRAGRVRFAGWQAATEIAGIGSHWDVAEGRLTAFSGLLWPRGGSWRPGVPWATQLAAELATSNPATDPDAFHGTYAVVSLGDDGSGFVAADPLGLGILYRAENDDVVVVSTRASLAARAVTPPGRAPARDRDALAWMIYASNLVDDRTGYEAVRSLPIGAHLHLDPGTGPETRNGYPPPWSTEARLDVTDLRGAAAMVAEELGDQLRTYAGHDVQFELSGGKDSRILLAQILANDLADRFQFITWGSPALPDTWVADALAERFGLRRSALVRLDLVEANATVEPDPVGYHEQLLDHVRRTSGSLSTWELRTMRRYRPTLSISGVGGEALRTNYPRTDDTTSMEDLARKIRGRAFAFDRAGVLRPEVRQRLDERVEEMMQELLPPGGTPQDAIDAFFLVGRMRPWQGPILEVDRRNRIPALCTSRTALRAAFSIGATARRREELHHELIRAACPELVTMPFAGDRGWKPELGVTATSQEVLRRTAPAADGTGPDGPRRPLSPEERAAHSRVVGAGARGATSTQERQALQLDEKLPVLRRTLDLAADHPLFDVVDRDALSTAVDRFADLPVGARRTLHGAVTAAIWLSGEEQVTAADA